MADALRSERPADRLLDVRVGTAKPWLWAKNIGNLWRTTGDIWDSFDAKDKAHDWAHPVLEIVDLNEPLWPFAGPGHWNDPDMLEVGNGGMTPAEYRAHFSLWAMMAAPLIAGNDIAHMDASDAIDPAQQGSHRGRPGRARRAGHRVWKDGDREVWVKPLRGGAGAVLLFNRGDTAGDDRAQPPISSAIRRACVRSCATCGRIKRPAALVGHARSDGRTARRRDVEGAALG